MIKKSMLLFLCFIAVLIPTSFPVAETVNNQHFINVKLVPSADLSIELSGSYIIQEVNNSENIPFVSNQISIRHSLANSVSLIVDGIEYTSTEGFSILEQRNELENIASLSTIKQSNEFKKMSYRGSFLIQPGKDHFQLFNIIELDDYLKSVVPNEMPAIWEMEALKAQAVAARNYAFTMMQKNVYLEDTTVHQVYRGIAGEHPRTNTAIEETKGIFALYNGKPIEAYYHSSSGGATENSENVWQSEVPYIRGVEDPYDQHIANPHTLWEPVAITSTNMVEKLFEENTDKKILSVKVTDRTIRNSVQSLDVTYIDLLTQEMNVLQLPNNKSANSLRSVFGTPLKSLQFTIEEPISSIQLLTASDPTAQQLDFLYGSKLMLADGSSISINENNVNIRFQNGLTLHPTAPTEFSFRGKGWGHRLGMSQWGARGMAEAGFTYEDILKYYYTGITLQPLSYNDTVQ